MALTLLVFARAPEPGRCKTRLIPQLGARGAAWVQMRLVEHLLALGSQLRSANRTTPEANLRLVLSCSPSTAHPFFQRCARRYGAQLKRQAMGDLGKKMRRALAAELSHGPVLLVGSDAFWLELSDLHAAAHALRTADYHLTPALDGGYVQFAARQLLPDLRGIAWSSGRELKQTLERLGRSGRISLAQHHRGDFDTPSDWLRARRAGRIAPLIHQR